MGGRGNSGSRNQGTAAQAQATETKDTRQYRSRTNSIDQYSVMNGAYFKSAADLLATIHHAESEGYDILSRNTNPDGFGTILYTWSAGDEEDAYEVYYEKTYDNPANPNEVVIRRFRHYEKGEW